MNWTAEQDAELTRLLMLGYSALEIGRAMHCSRNAVIGRTRRIEAKTGFLIRRRAAPKQTKFDPVKMKVRKTTLAATSAVTRPRRLFRIKPATAVRVSVVCRTTNAQIASILRVTGCRFAVTDDMPHKFCNAPMKKGSSYCEHHHARCYDGLPHTKKHTRPVVSSFAMRAWVMT